MVTKGFKARHVASSIQDRLSVLEKIWHWHVTVPGKLLMIRPVSRRRLSEIGSNDLAADVKQKA
jgi:hypothetical protein